MQNYNRTGRILHELSLIIHELSLIFCDNSWVIGDNSCQNSTEGAFYNCQKLDCRIVVIMLLDLIWNIKDFSHSISFVD